MLRTVHTLCGLKTVSVSPKSLEATQRIQRAKECTDLSKIMEVHLYEVAASRID